METNIGNGRWSKDNPKAVRARNCEICKEAKLGLGIRWGWNRWILSYMQKSYTCIL